MALTERYVSVAGGGAHDGTSEANAFTLSEMVADINTPRVGYRYNVKAGTYTRTASDTLTGDGTAASPNVIRGYNSTPGDLDTQGRASNNLALDTTNFPVIAYNATYLFSSSGANCLGVMNLKFTGNRSGPICSLGVSSLVYQCYADNVSTNSAAVGFSAAQAAVTFFGCDATLSGGSGGRAAFLGSTDSTIVNCLVLASPNAGYELSASGARVIDSVCRKNVPYPISFTSSGTSDTPPLVYGCTLYLPSTDGILAANVAYLRPLVLINCHVTDSAGYVVNSGYVATANLALIMIANRTRDNVSGISNGFADWAEAFTLLAVTTDTGGAETDFRDATNGDLRLIDAAPAVGTGRPKFRDIGALQRKESLPVVGNVKSGVTYGGDTDADRTGTGANIPAGSRSVIIGG